VAGYSGDAGNALMVAKYSTWVANGRKFTTRDSDNDAHATSNCAVGKGGWWLGRCTNSHINRSKGARWFAGPDPVYDVKNSRMLVKLN